jgi:hypothetical protein
VQNLAAMGVDGAARRGRYVCALEAKRREFNLNFKFGTKRGLHDVRAQMCVPRPAMKNDVGRKTLRVHSYGGSSTSVSHHV